MMEYSNIFYFRIISKIGGTEQFLYEIAKKYKDYDITIFYDEADLKQLQRLRRYVRCIKRNKGEIVKCKKAFFNFNSDMIDEIEAEEYWFVSHAIYQELGYIPPIGKPQFTNYLGVSKYSARMLEECATKVFNKEIKAIPCYNPLTLEPKEKVINIVSAGRLEDKTKGGKRTIDLIKALDRYCEKTGRHYIWHIFTNPVNLEVQSPNVCIMKPRVDVRPYIANADYVAQLSNDMETYCYTINEALGYGVPVISTPLSVYEELPVDDNMVIKMDFDGGNVEDVARQVFEKEVKPFKYIPPKDDWENILALDKSTYEEERYMKVEVKCVQTFYDLESKCDRTIGETWDCNRERGEHLEELRLVEITRTIKETKKEKATPKTRKEKATQ